MIKTQVKEIEEIKVRKFTRQFLGFQFVNINHADNIDSKPLTTDLPLEIIHNQLFISRVKSKPRCDEFPTFETRIWRTIRHLRKQIRTDPTHTQKKWKIQKPIGSTKLNKPSQNTRDPLSLRLSRSRRETNQTYMRLWKPAAIEGIENLGFDRTAREINKKKSKKTRNEILLVDWVIWLAIWLSQLFLLLGSSLGIIWTCQVSENLMGSKYACSSPLTVIGFLEKYLFIGNSFVLIRVSKKKLHNVFFSQNYP